MANPLRMALAKLISKQKGPVAQQVMGESAAASQASGRKSFRAYHGSPHDFDRFSMDYLGKGEGNQAFGPGLYFAEKEGVAKSYRDNLAGMASVNDPRLSETEKRVMMWLSNGFDYERMRTLAKRENRPDLLQAIDKMSKQGRMYEVNINADPDDFLDWDKSLKGLSPDHRAALERVAGGSLSDQLKVGTVVKNRVDANATKALREAGIPGIKYLDQGSRTAGDGSRNYVVFDDSIIEILRKYGIAGLTAGTGASQAGPLMDAIRRKQAEGSA